MKAFFILILFDLLVSRGYGRLKGDCSPQVDIPCQLHKFSGNDCSSDNLKSIFPFYETDTTNFPGKPGSFDSVLSYRYLSGWQTWYPEANLTFTTPHNAAMKSVKGFEITRYDRSHNIACYILDLSNVTWDESSPAQMDTKFHLNLFPLDPTQPAVFEFEAYALPKQQNKDGKYDQYLRLFVQFPAYSASGTSIARNWKPIISFTEDNNLGTIYVNIATPPAAFRFKKFEYTLHNTETDSNLYMSNSLKTSHNFTMVPTGTYRILAKPVKDGVNECPCKDVSGQICDNCSITSTEEFNFSASKRPLSAEDAIMADCTEYNWNITIAMDKLQQIYPGAKGSDIYLGENRCSGEELQGQLIFREYDLRQCLTSKQILHGDHVYNNELVYAEHDPVYKFIILNFNWTIGVQCNVQKDGSVSGGFTSQHVSTTPQFPISIYFYKDPNFTEEIGKGNPLQADIGSQVYVKVFTTVHDWLIKMSVQTCFTKPFAHAHNHMKYFLIKNGCDVNTNTNTNIMSQSSHETRFVFDNFHYTGNNDGLYMFCDALFCDSSDMSVKCRQTCNP